VLEIGGRAVHVPAGVTWEHELVRDGPPEPDGYEVLDSISELPALLQKLSAPPD
jgi:hypothetical protein